MVLSTIDITVSLSFNIGSESFLQYFCLKFFIVRIEANKSFEHS